VTRTLGYLLNLGLDPELEPARRRAPAVDPLFVLKRLRISYTTAGVDVMAAA